MANPENLSATFGPEPAGSAPTSETDYPTYLSSNGLIDTPTTHERFVRYSKDMADLATEREFVDRQLENRDRRAQDGADRAAAARLAQLARIADMQKRWR